MLRRTTVTHMAASQFIPLRRIPTQRSWDFSEPTLVKAGRFTQRVEWAVDDSDVVDHVARKYPTLAGIMKAGGLTLKGGAIASLLMGKSPSDLDLYVAGTTSVEESQARAKQVLQAAVDVTVQRALAVEREKIDTHQRVANGQFAFAAATDGGRAGGAADRDSLVPLTDDEIAKRLHDAKTRALSNLHGMRRGGVITVIGIPGIDVPVQISLRPFDTVESLVDDGDVDAGAIGLNDERGLMISHRGAFALQNWTVHAVDPNGNAARSLSPVRLQSYFDRGFDIVLPGFNAAAVRPPIQRVASPTCFELCDGQLVVETDLARSAEPRLTNRIQVQEIFKAQASATANDRSDDADRAATTSASERFELFAAAESAAVADAGESSVPEALFDRVAAAASRAGVAEGAARRESDLLRQQLKKHAVKSVRHNVGELLRGGRRFHTLLGGARITELADLREVPVTLRNVESVLYGAGQGIAKDPFGPNTVRQLLHLFPVLSPVQGLRDLLPPTATAANDGAGSGGLKRHVARTLEGFQRRQLEEAATLLDKCHAALAAEPLDALLPPPVTHDATMEMYYGSDFVAKRA